MKKFLQRYMGVDITHVINEKNMKDGIYRDSIENDPDDIIQDGPYQNEAAAVISINDEYESLLF